MKNNGTGGMQSSRANASITCPKCGKSAYRKESYEYGINGEAYAHFGKSGSFWHVFDGCKWVTMRKHWKEATNGRPD